MCECIETCVLRTNFRIAKLWWLLSVEGIAETTRAPTLVVPAMSGGKQSGGFGGIVADRGVVTEEEGMLFI